MSRNLRGDLQRFHDYGVLIPNRSIYFGSEGDTEGEENGVDYASIKKLIKNLLFLDQINHKTITLYWNSPGGDWFRGIAVYDIIKKMKSPVKFIGLGMVRSMGTIISQACKHRYLTSNCDYMIHDGSEANAGIPKTFEAWGKYSEYTRKKMYDIYYVKMKKKNSRITKKQIEEWCGHDYIITSKEAVKLGLADKVI
ncbi:hypothetical protein LCGC14_0667080 [marine sediment metagenome]|uniref:ATP-dependent Clp protease proteolytic subunit n=1 Tax=marine sediment metagenome TaxID=412755 RepID=A0A0F9TDE4_9ZZZZ